jgi:hypothetical protein
LISNKVKKVESGEIDGEVVVTNYGDIEIIDAKG